MDERLAKTVLDSAVSAEVNGFTGDLVGVYDQSNNRW